MDVTIQDLTRAIVNGDSKKAVAGAQALIAQGLSVRQIIQVGLTQALESLGVKCTTEEFNLLEIMLAGRAMMDVMDLVVVKQIQQEPGDPLETGACVILGVIKGDVHDLGKHIVYILLKMAGFRVIDLGKDVDPGDFVEAAAREGARYIGVSGLITTSVPFVKEIRDLAGARGLKGIEVAAGGAALQQANPHDLNVDRVFKDAFDFLYYLKDREAKDRAGAVDELS